MPTQTVNGASLYFEESGSLTFYDPEGNPTHRVPDRTSG